MQGKIASAQWQAALEKRWKRKSWCHYNFPLVCDGGVFLSLRSMECAGLATSKRSQDKSLEYSVRVAWIRYEIVSTRAPNSLSQALSERRIVVNVWLFIPKLQPMQSALESNILTT